MHEYCLNLLCPPSVEEKLLDVLLDSEGVVVFTSVQVHHYGLAAARLSAQEQVMGRSQSLHIQILLSEAVLKPLLERVQRDFAGTGIRYWASPVAFEGEIK